MERRTPKKVVVTEDAIKKAGAQATKASAKLEGREVPADFVRSEAVTRYIEQAAARYARDVPIEPGIGARLRQMSSPAVSFGNPHLEVREDRFDSGAGG